MAIAGRNVRVQVIGPDGIGWDISGMINSFEITTGYGDLVEARLSIVGDTEKVTRFCDKIELSFTTDFENDDAFDLFDEAEYEDDDEEPEKIRCPYCGQYNHKKALCCEFCGGRL